MKKKKNIFAFFDSLWLPYELSVVLFFKWPPKGSYPATTAASSFPCHIAKTDPTWANRTVSASSSSARILSQLRSCSPSTWTTAASLCPCHTDMPALTLVTRSPSFAIHKVVINYQKMQKYFFFFFSKFMLITPEIMILGSFIVP